jgi:hypothetical protein
VRILWIGKDPTDGAPGDEVWDRKTIGICRDRGHSVDLFRPKRVGRVREAVNLLSGVPHYRTRYVCAANLAGIRDASAGYDITICSWEPFDALASGPQPPTIQVLHNVTSRALPSLFPGNPLAAVGAARARAWERQAYRLPRFAALGSVSRRDQRYLEALPGHPHVIYIPPGMAPCVDLAADAPLLQEIGVSGTFDWVPKHRDVLRFAKEFSALGTPIPVRASGLPDLAMQQLRPTPLPVADMRTALRFGLVTDRFEAGHKLKTLAYIAENQIVLSFAEIGDDFAHIPDWDLFLRRIHSVSDIQRHVRAVSDMPLADLRDRFLTFKQRCAQEFTWERNATELLATATGALTRRHEQLATV